MENKPTAQDHLQLIVSEHDKIRLLASAYEQGNYAGEVDTEIAEKLKDELWTLDPDDVAPVANELREQLSAFDDTIAWLDRLGTENDARYQECVAEKKQAETDFNTLRKKLNSTNISRGIWPIYGGVLIGIMAAWLANQLDLGMAGSIIAGALGYFVGNQLMQQVTKRLNHPSAAKKDDSDERAALDALRGRYEELSREHDRLANARDCLAKAVNHAEDIQFAISEALHEAEAAE